MDLGSDIGIEVVDGVSPDLNVLSGSCGGGSGNESVFSWTAPATGTYIMDTMEWYRDTVLYVYDDLCTGTELACNESPSTSARSVVSVDLQESQTVTVVIDTDGSDSTATGLSIYPESDSCNLVGVLADSWTEPFAHVDTSFAGSCVPMIAPVWWGMDCPG